MKETYLYHGHSIDLDLTSLAEARTRWTYFIDEDYCSQGTTDASPMEAVRVGALALAHRSIGVLEAIRDGRESATPATESSVVSTMMDHGPQRFETGR